jgi:uncharacterized protein involved in exopolysaccharide biosynthesis
MSLADFIVGAWRRRVQSIVIIVVCVAASVVLALVTPPVYRATAVVAPAADSSGLGGLAGLAGQFGGIAALAGLPFGRDDNRVEAMGVLRSRLVIRRLVEEHDLMPVLFAKRWDAASKTWKAGAEQPTMGDAYLMFERRILQVREDLKTGLISVRVDWTDRERCAEWAQWIVDIANEEMRGRAIHESTASLAVLEKQYAGAESVALRGAISNLMELQLRARTMAEVRKEYVFKLVDPPVTPDSDKRVKPTRTLMVLLGGFLGGLLAVLVAAILDFRVRLRAAAGRS